jgi:acetoin utilization protein AcuB
MKHMPQVVGAMTPFPFAIGADASVAEARAMMHERNVRHLPVIDDGKLAGVITDRDVKLALGPDLDYPEGSDLKVRDVFVANAYTVDAGTRLDEVAATMAERHIGSALVTREGKLCGVFTATDACRALARCLRERFPAPERGNDAA